MNAIFESKRRHQSRSCDDKNTSSNNNKQLLAGVAMVAVAATAVAAYSGLRRSVKEYGWGGALRSIWEGDPYDPELRDAVDKLEEAEYDLATSRLDDRLRGLEESLDIATAVAASSSSSSGAIDRLWNDTWMDHPTNLGTDGDRRGGDSSSLNVERSLADISYRLDKIAARVDGVILSSAAAAAASGDKTERNPTESSDFLAQRVKKRKQSLSKAIVQEMERCDALVATFKVLKERAQ
mmetsp:Transcript_3249/g.7134  ORF Transcript_3249/g.7134 Transcript_3249/m.7134 type:complete len:238 (-) Transcript_3249:656-1369(-)|eukprot:CAMPEP_0201207692 /NCGR_PEP_ID=MMETSP0851-20130426/174962_1 /ASSEMBLY_ACC=CAM_ASM_000631 /TAXON_ID=183588 /ORGANISM="Pseudo-nitzschia fraudulenta, Strain WWA7" /LENGTH=237 /DNA_ID=CAMNT_0047496159 /DNA_START=60 /DNA_END=773 /DNA_ORIENTATION=+